MDDFVDWVLKTSAFWKIVFSAVAGILSIILAFRTIFWRRMQMRNWLQAEQFQSDSHTLRLCEALNEESPRLQMAAAALLFERLQQGVSRAVADRERSAIIQALLAATIGDQHLSKQTSTSPQLCKYIADSVVEILDAKAIGRKQSPLRDYYWQKVQLMDAYWSEVDARGVDFFGAIFDRASLRRANLEGAVFYAASLVGTTLVGANLRNADFRDADLRSADLRDDNRNTRDVRRTEWSGIRLSGAKYDANTRFPPEMNPSDLGMREVQLSAAIE